MAAPIIIGAAKVGGAAFARGGAAATKGGAGAVREASATTKGARAARMTPGGARTMPRGQQMPQTKGATTAPPQNPLEFAQRMPGARKMMPRGQQNLADTLSQMQRIQRGELQPNELDGKGMFSQGGQMISALLVKAMVGAALPSFGFTLIPLLFYTIIKDISQLKSLADPVEAIITPGFGKGAGAARGMTAGGGPEAAESSSPTDSMMLIVKLLGRVFGIYPLGLIATIFYGTILILIILIAYAATHPGETIAKLLGF